METRARLDSHEKACAERTEALRADIARLTGQLDSVAQALNKVFSDTVSARANIQIEASQSWARVAWSLVGALGTGLLALAGLFARAKGWY